MTTAFYSSVLDHPIDRVWELVRDFNNYPRYIDGVIESVIEDGKRGDEVGAVRNFNYQGNWIRQRLVRHSDAQHLLTYAGIDPFAVPAQEDAATPQPVRYEVRSSCTGSSMATAPSSNGRWSSTRRRARRSGGSSCSWP
jgi:hypothetical protein